MGDLTQVVLVQIHISKQLKAGKRNVLFIKKGPEIGFSRPLYVGGVQFDKIRIL